MSEPLTIGAAIAAARRRLAAAGIEASALEARLLAAHALGCDMAALIGRPERRMDAARSAGFEAVLRRRLSREPLAYILGRREFWSLTLRVTTDTLIPRPDTETLVEAALAWAGGRHTRPRVLDLGTGSGCLLLALLGELPQACGVGLDRSPAALVVARGNAERLGLGERARFVCADWAAALAGAFEIIVGNPPYIADGEWDDLPPDVRHFEPSLALRGGVDGTDAYRCIFSALPRLLAPDGAAFFEIGGASAPAVLRLASASGLQVVETVSDLGGRPRCLELHAAACEVRKKFLGNQVVPV